MKQIRSLLKPYLHWIILGGMLLFLTKAFQAHWQEVSLIRIDSTGWIYLSLATIVTLLAFTWAGWVWSLTLRQFKQPLENFWVIKVYLKTHIAKYLPGHLWHYYGRIWNAKSAGVSAEVATLSVAIEPFLMLAAALLFAIISSQLCGSTALNLRNCSWQVPCLIGVMMVVHPRIVNPILRYGGKLKGKKKDCTGAKSNTFKLERYPLMLLLGEIGFIGLRCGGFLLTFMALSPVHSDRIFMLISSFSLAWLLSVVVPGAPGGVGVFEGTAIALLNQSFSTGLVLSVVALFRLITILAEATGALLAWLDDRRCTQKYSLATDSITPLNLSD